MFLSADSNPKTYLTCAISCYDPCRLDLLDLGGVGDDSPGTRNANVPAGRRTTQACRIMEAVPAHKPGTSAGSAESGSAATNATRTPCVSVFPNCGTAIHVICSAGQHGNQGFAVSAAFIRQRLPATGFKMNAVTVTAASREGGRPLF